MLLKIQSLKVTLCKTAVSFLISDVMVKTRFSNESKEFVVLAVLRWNLKNLEQPFGILEENCRQFDWKYYLHA